MYTYQRIFSYSKTILSPQDYFVAFLSLFDTENTPHIQFLPENFFFVWKGEKISFIINGIRYGVKWLL